VNRVQAALGVGEIVLGQAANPFVDIQPLQRVVNIARRSTDLYEQTAFTLTRHLLDELIGLVLIARLKVRNQIACQLQSTSKIVHTRAPGFLLFRGGLSHQAVAATRSKILSIFSCKVCAVNGLTM